MSKRIVLFSAVAFGALALTATFVAPVIAQEKTVMVGGAAMFPSKNIIQNAVNSKDHTTLVAAVKAAGLVSTLEGKGPFTVFAPTNAAFGKLPAGTVDNLVKPENKATLTKILTYHVVAGKLEASDGKYYEAMGQVFKEIHRVLKPGGHMGLYVSDSYEHGKQFHAIGFELFARMRELLEPIDIISVVRHNKTLEMGNYRKAAEEQNFFLRGFNYLFIFRKR